MEGHPPPPPIKDDDKFDDSPTFTSTNKSTSAFTPMSMSTSTSDVQTNHKDPNANSTDQITLPPPPGRDLDTYVVQFPRDQIYKVPPPQNAEFVELYRKPVKKNRSGGCKCLFWFIVLLIVLGLVVGANALTISLVFRPTAPAFSVEDFEVKSEKSTRKTFGFGLRAKNSNDIMGIEYKESHSVYISVKNKNIGRGKFPELSQEAKGSDKIQLTLESSKNAALPNAKSPATMSLEFDVEAEFSVRKMKLKKKKLSVTCEIKAKGLEAGRVKILSENCQSEFKN